MISPKWMVVLLVAAQLPAALSARRLHQCSSNAVAVAGSSGEDSVAQAVASSLAECVMPPAVDAGGK
jgi:hypothetical protein